MTESPINLDEANGLIDEGKRFWESVRHRPNDGILRVRIRRDYLESIVSELVAARERIAKQEALLLDPAFQTAIIPRADDADSLHFMLDYLCDDSNDNRDPEIEIAKKVLHRYLAAIEGGKL